MSSSAHTQIIRNDHDKAMYHHPEDPKNTRPASRLQLGTRHAQCLIMFLGVASSFCVKGHLSVAIVSMTKKSSSNIVPVFAWNSRMKGTIESAFYWSYIFLLIPAGRVAEKFGPKLPLVISMLACGIIMVLTPFAAVYGGFYGMVATRVLIGATQAFIYPSINVFLSNWAPPKEKEMLFSFVHSGMDFGTVVIMSLAGVLVDSRAGWPSVFYVTGGITMLWALLYAYHGASSPQDHKTISKAERSYIVNSLWHSSQEKDSLKTPWKAILSSVPLLAITIAHCAHTWGYYTLHFYAPTYISDVLGLSMKQSGLLAALPYLSSLIAGNFYALMSYWLNKRKFLSKTALLKAWNSYSSWGSALTLCLLALAEKNKILVVTLLILALTINVAIHNGFHANHLDLSPNFAGTLMGITTAVSTISTMGTPLYVGIIVTDSKSVYLWRIVFLTAAIVMFVGNLFFILFATADVQPWNFPPTSVKPNLKDSILRVKLADGKKRLSTISESDIITENHQER